MKKQRIDKILVERGFAVSRTKAQALVMSGVVLVNERRVEKPSESFLPEEPIRLKGDSPEAKYVGRGGLKLERALEHFQISPGGFVCLDVGASTGGFTDCLLQSRATRVVAVDVGTNQLDWKIRSDDRVDVRENINARYLKPTDFDHGFDLIVMDVSFISATMILPVLLPLLRKNGKIICLVKPQFEVGKGEVGKGGVVRDPQKHEEAVARVNASAEALGLRVGGIIESPILGAEGNKEFLVLFDLPL